MAEMKTIPEAYLCIFAVDHYLINYLINHFESRNEELKLTEVSGGTCLDSWSDLIDTELGGLTEHHSHLLSHRGRLGRLGYLHRTAGLLGDTGGEGGEDTALL